LSLIVCADVNLQLQFQLVGVRRIVGSGLRPRLFDAARQHSVDDRAQQVEAAADKEHVHPLFARALRTQTAPERR